MTPTTESQIRRILRHDSQHAKRCLRTEDTEALHFAARVERAKSRPRRRLLRWITRLISEKTPCPQ